MWKPFFDSPEDTRLYLVILGYVFDVTRGAKVKLSLKTLNQQIKQNLLFNFF